MYRTKLWFAQTVLNPSDQSIRFAHVCVTAADELVDVTTPKLVGQSGTKRKEPDYERELLQH